MHKSIFALATFVGALLFAGCATTQKFPANCDPKTVGQKVCANFLPRKIYYNTAGYIVYPEVCAAFGALRFAGATGDAALQQQLIARYESILTPEGRKVISAQRHVDFHVFGVLPLQIYLLTGDDRYLDLGIHMADDQWVNPRPDGLCEETRWWVDDANSSLPRHA
jgi:rhamnogalacturonyl hydrolase YesR